MLKLEAAPNRVRLLREVEGGGAPVPLDSRGALAAQGVGEGASVVVEVLPPPPPPPSPAQLARERQFDLAVAAMSALAALEAAAAAPPVSASQLGYTFSEALAAQGVGEGASVVVEVLPPPPPPHVLVRLSGSARATKVAYAPGADVDDHARAAIAVFRLDLASNRVRLLREVEGGGEPVPLHTGTALSAQGVREGTRVLVEFPPLPLANLFGVITRRPDAALDAGLLAALAGADTPDVQRLEALSALAADHLTRYSYPSTDEPPALPLFHTAAHATLLRVLVDHARTLSAGYFKGINGAPCRTLLGARGIGKSALMRAFALVAPSAFPGLMPVYLSGQGITHPLHALHAGHLQDVLAAAAEQQHLPFNNVRMLPTGRRLLLLVDEVDDLYRVSAVDPALARRVLATLGMLCRLGDRTDGNSSVLLCGSSSATYRLVQGMNARLEHTFPLVRLGIPDLNCTKFECLRLPAPLCNDSAEVEAMLATVAGSSGWAAGHARSTAAARLLAFFVGASPRAVACAALPQGVKGLTGALLASFAALSAPLDTDFVHPGTGALLRALLAKLAAKNGELCAQTRKADGSANFLAIMDPACLWEQAVTPLTMQEVEAEYQEVAQAAATAAGAAGAAMAAGVAAAPPYPANLASMLDEITDKHLLRVHHPCGLEATEVWPVTAAQVVAGGVQRSADLTDAAAAISRAMKEVALLAHSVKPFV